MKLMLKRHSQRGITSIVVVFVLVVLLTLVGIGFTKVMNRSLQSSSASEQASAASYAAQSGINDAISYIAKSLQANPGADVASTQCGQLIDPGGPLEAAAKLSPDGNTAYTCVLVDPNPSSLFYQNLAPYKSQVIKITTNTPLSSLLLSWQASDRTRNQFVPAANGTVLYDEKTWSDANYAPLLRVTLYPIPASGDLSNVQANSKTFFLYPQSGGGNTLAYGSPSGLAPVNCSSKSLGSFSGTPDYDCNLVVTNLTSTGASYFYARLTPFYAQSVIKVKANDGSNQAVSFKNVQSVIDVTAKSGSAVKRLQARMDSSSSSSGTDLNISPGSDNAPEFALQATNTLCKRLVIPPATTSPATIDPGSVLNCGLSLTDATPPVAPASGDSGSGSGGGSSGDSFAPASGGGGPIVCTITKVDVSAGIFNGNCTNSNQGGVWNTYRDSDGCLVVTLSDVSYRGYATDAVRDCSGASVSFSTCPLGFEKSSSGKCVEKKAACPANSFVVADPTNCVASNPSDPNKYYPPSCESQGLTGPPGACKKIDTIVPAPAVPKDQPSPPRNLPPEDWPPVISSPPSSGGGSSQPTPTPTPTPTPAPVIDDFSCGVMHLPLQRFLPFYFGRLAWC